MTKDVAGVRMPSPVEFLVNGLTLRGLSWGEPGQQPLLALHGWLDNAASFHLLAPLLGEHYVIALDLTGHGQSSMRSADASYQIWDDLPEILGVIEQLSWQRFDLLGHSRGAIIATLLASACPERVARLVLLDAVTPPAVAEQDFPGQLRKALDDKPRLLQREERAFASVQEAVTNRVERGLPADTAQVLVERNLRPCAGGVTWTTDPRLQGASAVKLTEGQVVAVLRALTMPTLLLLASQSPVRAPQLAKLARQCISNLVLEEIEGGHHNHMETRVVATLAQRVNGFLHGEGVAISG